MNFTIELGLALIIQFAGIVWFSSKLTEKVNNLSRALTELKVEVSLMKTDIEDERLKTVPLITLCEVMGKALEGLRLDIRELRQELRK